jgi:hypothetical protein
MPITCTIDQNETQAWVDEFFDGTRTEDQDFPFGRAVRNVVVGDYLYMIWRGLIRGRLRITRIQHIQETIEVGTHEKRVRSRSVVWVECPGEPAGSRIIERESHRGHRWDDVAEW